MSSKIIKFAIITFAVIILCTLLFLLFKSILPAYESNVIRFDSFELSRFDIESKTHDLSSWVNYLTNKFSYLYSRYDVSYPSQVFVDDFCIDIEKDDDGWYISKLIMSVSFQDNNQQYVQSFNVWPDTASSYIVKSSISGEGQFTDIDKFFSRLDKLDLGYFADKLPECEYYHFEYVCNTTTFHKNTPDIERFLVNKDSVEYGEMPDDKEIGTRMQVFCLSSLIEISEGQHQSNDSVDIYLNS